MTIRQELIAKIIKIRSEVVDDDRCFRMRSNNEVIDNLSRLEIMDQEVLCDLIETLCREK
jgi:hypothetical protein